MSLSRHKARPQSPIYSLLHQLGISERRFHSELTTLDSGTMSVSNFSRLLKEEEHFDMRDVESIGRLLGPYLHLESDLASQAVLAEHWVWRNTLHGVLAQEANLTLRGPVVRHDQFRSAVKSILAAMNYESPQLVSITAANEKQVGRNSFALSVAQYCAYDAPPAVRRTLRVCSLAQLNSDKQIARDVNVERIAGLISVQLGLPRRNRDDQDSVFVARIIDDIADSFRYLPRPLLLIKDAHGVPDSLLADFVDRLLTALPHESKLTVLITSERSLLHNSGEVNINLDYMTPEEVAAFIAWKTDANDAQRSTLIRLCEKLRREVRKPSVASLLAGAYLLQQFRHSSPWVTFPPIAKAPDGIRTEDDIAAVICDVVDAVAPGRSIESIQISGDVFAAALRSPGSSGKAMLTHFERVLLFMLAIFDGRFTKRAAQACFGTVTLAPRRRSADREATKLAAQACGGEAACEKRFLRRIQRFERTLDRLCLLGAVTCEQPAAPHYFSLEGDLKTWIRGMLPYETFAKEAKYRYFQFLDREVHEALYLFRKDPYAVDTASRDCFARLEPEARQIDIFLVDIWSQMDKGDMALPTPELTRREVDDLSDFDDLSEWGRKIAWVGLLCANLALFWEAANLPGTAKIHLQNASDWMKKMESKEASMTDETQRELCAIRAQLILSLLCIEVRQRRSGIVLQRWRDMLDEAKPVLNTEKCKAQNVDYKYGLALHDLLDGMICNREDCHAGLHQMNNAARLARECIEADGAMTVPTKLLRMSKERQPIARYLAFMVQREIARAQLRSGCIPESIATERTLLRAAKMTREPRLVADTLIALTHSCWFEACLEATQPLSEKKLSKIREQLFQIDAHITPLPIDRSTLLAHYITMMGIYNLEKGLAGLTTQSEKKDHIEDRRTFGEDLFATGISQVTDTHFRGLYFAFAADAYLRLSLVTGEPTSLLVAKEGPSKKQSKKQEKQQDLARPVALASAYLVRSLSELLHEVGNHYPLSVVLGRLFRRMYERIDNVHIEAAIVMHCATTGSRQEYELRSFRQRYLTDQITP